MLPQNRPEEKQENRRKKHIVALFLFSLVAVLGVCIIVVNYLASSIGCNTEKAWQHNFKKALLEGYTDFKGRYVNEDIAVYIFTYRYPLSSAKNTEEVFAKLKKQLTSEFNVYSESSDQLVLRRSVTYSSSNGFDEYRFMVDPDSRKVTVLFANLDSPVELKQHGQLVARQQSIHKMKIDN